MTIRTEDHFQPAGTHDGHAARSVTCPFCHAQAGEPCHSHGHGEEVHVHRDHQARFDAFHAAPGSGH